MEIKTDWNLIIQGNISLLWNQECLKPENRKKTIEELLSEFRLKYENCGILNCGTLFMATYLLFVYPKEKEFESCDKSNLKTDAFKITDNDYVKNKIVDSSYIVRRIRNSLAHGNFTIEEDVITFEDWVPNEKELKPDYFKCKIRVGEFGNFINSFMFEIKNQRFGSSRETL